MISSGRLRPLPLRRAEIRPARLFHEDLHRNAFFLEHALQVIDGGLLVAGRIARVHAHERLEVLECLRVEGRFARCSALRPRRRLRACGRGRTQ